MNLCYYFMCALVLVSGVTTAQTVSTVVTGSTFNDGLALDSDGNVYAAEYFGTRITRIATDGTDSVWATGLDSPNGIAFHENGDLYVPNFGADNIIVIDPAGMQTELVGIADPGAILINDDGSLLVANYSADLISHIDTAGNITTFLSGSPLNGPIGLVRDDSGTLYVGNFTDGKVFRYTVANGLEEIGDLPGNLGFMTMANNVIFATAYLHHRIYMVPLDGSGEVSFAGTGVRGGADGPAGTATFNNPNGITSTSTGDTLYVSEWARNLRMITGVLAVTGVRQEEGVATEFTLDQNYPNPFNPATTISFAVPGGTSGETSLVIYDLLGREVAELVNERLAAGRYSVTWDAAGHASGIYYYRLRNGDFVETRKLMLLR